MNKSGQKINKNAVYTLFQFYWDMELADMNLDMFLDFLKIPGTPIAK